MKIKDLIYFDYELKFQPQCTLITTLLKNLINRIALFE